MIDTTLFTAQIEVAHWGWTIAFFLWFVGLSGMGMFVNYWLRDKWMVNVCAVAAVVGTLLVMSHLTRILNLPMAAIHSLLAMSFNFTSWMFIGICLLVVQCVATVLYALVAGGLIRCDACRRWFASDVVNGVLAACGVAVTIYSGFLLTQAVGVTFWNTALIPVLWIISGLASAFGAVELLAVSGRIDEGKVSGWTNRAGLWVEISELFALFALVHVGLNAASDAARMGAESLIGGSASMLFWCGAVACGAALPLILRIVTKNRTAAALGGILALAGALCLRAAVLMAGYYEPTLL